MKMDDRYNGWVRTKFWLGRCEQGAVFPQRTSKVEKKIFTNKRTGQRCNKTRLCFQRAYPFSARINCFNSPLLYISRKGDLGLPRSNKFD